MCFWINECDRGRTGGEFPLERLEDSLEMLGFGQKGIIGAERERDCRALLIRSVDKFTDDLVHYLFFSRARVPYDFQNF